MKTYLLKQWMLMLVAIAFTASGYAATVADLEVSGISNPANANGTYTYNGTHGGANKDSWKRDLGGGVVYYIYNDEYYGVYYWNIDNNDTDSDDDVLFYSTNESTADSPLSINDWTALSGSGTPVIQETGAPAAPEIYIKGNDTEIAHGDAEASLLDHTNFGSMQQASGSHSRLFYIHNAGTANLTVTDVNLSGTHAAAFSITDTSFTIASSSLDSFEVIFDPYQEGNHNASITIVNNDDDESNYTFTIHGHGHTPGLLTLSGITIPTAANGDYLYKGIHNRMQYWKHETDSFFIFNEDYNASDAKHYWNIDQDTIDTNNNYLFYLESEEGSPVSLTGWGNNTNSSDTSAGAPFITEGIAIPEIHLMGNNLGISNNDATPGFDDFTNFGALEVDSGSNTRSFTIINKGTDTLRLSGTPFVTLTGKDSADFSITIAPDSSIAPLDSSAFTVSFDPLEKGSREATINISSNDNDEPTFTFSIKGEGVVAHDLYMTGITNPDEQNGLYQYQGILNRFPYWKHETSQYYIYNDQYKTDGRYWNLDVDLMSDSSDFYSHSASEDVSPIDVGAWDIENGSSSTGTPNIDFFFETEVSTQEASNISPFTATINGRINVLGKPAPSSYGFVWNTNGNPSLANDSIIDLGSALDSGAYNAPLASLDENTDYFVKAFAINAVDTIYGDEVSFTTSVVVFTIGASSTKPLVLIPNPANDFISVAGEYEKLQIFNSNGMLVMKINNVIANNKIDISHLAQGIYFVKGNEQSATLIIE